MKKLNVILPLLISAALLVIAFYPELFAISGSRAAYFGIVNIVVPALSSVLSSLGLALGFAAYCLVKSAMGMYPITGGLPTLASAASLQSFSRSSMALNIVLNIALPIACIILFVAHPVGQEAAVYALYWLIPIAAGVVSLYQPLGYFGRALAATFVAHAIGSIMWLYTYASTSSYWLSLLPRVAVERLVFAAGIALVCAHVPWGRLASLRSLLLRRQPLEK